MTATMRCLFAAASMILWTSTAIAEPPASPQAQLPAEPQTQPSISQPKIDDVALAILIKSAIIAVQHANATGNYSVLRDLGTPGFRERYDQAKLTAILATFRVRAINLSPSLMLLPSLSKPVEFTPQGQLRVEGTFPTRPLQIQYALLFQQQGGAWRLDGIAVDAVPVEAGDASAVQAATQDPQKPKPVSAKKKAEAAAQK